MDFDAANKWVDTIRKRVQLMVGRGVLTLVDNEPKTQEIQQELLADEIISECEHLVNYGFDHYPIAGEEDGEWAETFTSFPGGNRDFPLVHTIHDRRFRPDYLQEGEVAIYSHEDKDTGAGTPQHGDGRGFFHRIWFKAGQIIWLLCVEFLAECETITLKAKTINLDADQINYYSPSQDFHSSRMP